MSGRSDADLVGDMREAMQRIMAYTDGMDFAAFLDNTQVQDAVVRNLQIIGEAVKRLSVDFRKQHAQIEWKKIAGLRDKVIHEYFGVNWDIVWDVVHKRIPELKAQLSTHA